MNIKKISYAMFPMKIVKNIKKNIILKHIKIKNIKKIKLKIKDKNPNNLFILILKI